jgi:hypothetical protein
MKNKLVKEYFLWVWQILKTELNSKRKMTAIKTLAVPVILQLWNSQLAKKRNGKKK